MTLLMKQALYRPSHHGWLLNFLFTLIKWDQGPVLRLLVHLGPVLSSGSKSGLLCPKLEWSFLHHGLNTKHFIPVFIWHRKSHNLMNAQTLPNQSGFGIPSVFVNGHFQFKITKSSVETCLTLMLVLLGRVSPRIKHCYQSSWQSILNQKLC